MKNDWNSAKLTTCTHLFGGASHCQVCVPTNSIIGHVITGEGGQTWPNCPWGGQLASSLYLLQKGSIDHCLGCLIFPEGGSGHWREQHWPRAIRAKMWGFADWWDWLIGGQAAAKASSRPSPILPVNGRWSVDWLDDSLWPSPSIHPLVSASAFLKRNGWQMEKNAGQCG